MAGPTLVWRIAKATKDYTANDLSGGGAAFTGGRWNSKGVAVVYAGSSIALSCLEALAHLGDEIAVRNRFLIRITIPPAVWKRRIALNHEALDPTWIAEPPCSVSIAAGDAWVTSADSAILEVPSVVIPEENNVLINPAHPDAKKVTAVVVRLFVYDPRL